MKLIDSEYTFDNNKVLFYFTADGRIDFRELVKDLASVFKTRIELRQIGVRDETKIVGGIGIAAKGLGIAIAAVPVLREGPVDEALIKAGESIGEYNRDAVQRKLQAFEIFEANRMMPFVENLQSVNILYNEENAMITDGVNLYLMQPA